MKAIVDLGQPGGEIGIRLAQRPGLFIADPAEHGRRRAGAER